MNPAQFHNFKKQITQSAFPASGAGFSSLGPNNAFRGGTSFENYQTLLIIPAPTDNKNGARDSNGYLVAIYYTPDWFNNLSAGQPTTNLAAVRINDKNSSSFGFAVLDVVLAFQYDVTKNSPDSTDDGYPLFFPCNDKIQVLQTHAVDGDTPYPVQGDACEFFPATPASLIVNWGASICAATMTGVTAAGNVCMVTNLVQDNAGNPVYIPQGTLVLAKGIKPGKPAANSNEYPAYVCEYVGQNSSETIIGSLGSNLTDTDPTFTTNTIVNFSADGFDPTKSGTVTITINNPITGSGAYRYFGSTGAFWTAVRWQGDKDYLLIDMDCPGA